MESAREYFSDLRRVSSKLEADIAEHWSDLGMLCFVLLAL